MPDVAVSTCKMCKEKTIVTVAVYSPITDSTVAVAMCRNCDKRRCSRCPKDDNVVIQASVKKCKRGHELTGTT